MSGVARGAAVGAAAGAVVGLLVGLIVHEIVDSGSLVTYEIVAGLCGLIIGTALGAFWGGALRLPPRDVRRSR